jgi:actin-related protein 3
MFKNFDKRLERQVQSRVNDRLDKYQQKSGVKPKAIGVNVTNSMSKQHSVWFGGSTFSTMVRKYQLLKSQFEKNVHTRAEYLEKGPSCCRFNPVFGFS